MADEINSAELVAALNNLASLSSEVSQSMAYNTEIMKKLAVAQGVNVKSLGSLDTDFAKLSGKTREQSALAQVNAHATEQMYKAAGNFSAALISSTASIVSLGKALLTTEKSFAKYGQGVDSAGDAALALGKNFGIVGTAIGAMAKAATMVVSASMKQADAALKTTDDLSSIGAAGQFTAKGVLEMGHSMGLTSKNMEVFSKAAKSVGTGLINLGDNAGVGVAAFAKMTAVSSESRQAFRRLGVSQEELMERQSDYVRLQEASGQMITKRMHADGKVQELSLKYAEDLTVISTITGKNAKEAAAGMAAAKASADIQLKQAMMQRQEEKLRSTGRTEEADDLKKQRLIQDQILNAAQQTSDAQVLAAVQNKIATGSYSEASSMLLRTGIDIDKTMSEANKKTLKQIEAEGVAGEAAAAFQTDYKDKMGKTIDSMGAGLIYSKDNMNKFGLSIAGMGFLAKTAETDIAARNKAALKTIEENKAKTGVAALDPAQQARNALTEAEIAAQVGLDRLLLSVNPLILGFTGTTVAATAFTVALGLASARMMALTAGSGVGGGTVAKIANAGMSMGGAAARFAGPAAGVVAAGSSIYGAYSDYKKATTTEGKAGAVGKGIGGAGGGIGGALSGAAAGAALGSVVPVLGTAVGGLIGAAVGGWLGSKGGELVGEKVGTVAGKALAGSSDDKTKLADLTKSQDELTDANKEASKKTEKSNDGLIKALNATTNSLNKVTGGASAGAASGAAGGTVAIGAQGGGGGGTAAERMFAKSQKQAQGAQARAAAAGAGGAAGGGRGSQGMSASGAADDGSVSKDPNTASAPASIKPGGASLSEKETKDMIKRHEGVRNTPYKDSLGLWTVGVGHLIGDGKTLPDAWNRTFSDQEINDLFDKDYEEHKKAAESIPGYNKFNSAGRGALTDLTFNMGPSWIKKFPNTSKNIAAGDAQGAAAGLQDSKWYTQVGNRAPEIVGLMEAGGGISARDGGITDGPTSGYPATLHGNEIITPLSANSILEQLGKTPASQAMSSTSTTSTSDTIKEIYSMNTDVMEMIAEKLDAVIDKLSSGNDISDKLLKYSRV